MACLELCILSLCCVLTVPSLGRSPVPELKLGIKLPTFIRSGFGGGDLGADVLKVSWGTGGHANCHTYMVSVKLELAFHLYEYDRWYSTVVLRKVLLSIG